MRKKFLERKLKRLQEKRESIKRQVDASTDAAEMRSLSSQLDEVDEEIAECREELEILETEERAADPVAPATAEVRNARTLGTFTTVEARENPLASMEYRQAFMKYAMNGTPIPAEFRGNAISTNETGVAIPMEIINKVINTVRTKYGNLYDKVNKTSVQGGVEYSIGALQGEFKWINESTVSPRQKTEGLGSVIFKYNTGEIRIAQTFLANIVTLSDFENKINDIIVRAYLRAMDYGIINGSGKGSMLGILNDPRVTNTVTLSASDINNWVQWKKKFFSKLTAGYLDGEFIFPASTVNSYLETMADSNNNPIFSQATGLTVDANNQAGRFFGKNISLVNSDIIPDFDTASPGDVIGIFWQPEEYTINENFGFTMMRYFDQKTNEWVNKAIVVVDGKVVNPTGYVKILKG